MLLGARNSFLAQKPIWTNPYVTDGLIAMWDGEWNAGGGIHDANATSIVDLSGNKHTLNFNGTYSIGSNYIWIDGTSGAYGYVDDFNFGVPTTQDMCVEVSSANDYGRFVAENRGLCIRSSGQVAYIYGFGTDGQVNNSLGDQRNAVFSQTLVVAGDNAGVYWFNGSRIGQRTTTNAQYSGTTYVFGRDPASAGGNTAKKGITGKLYNLRFYSRALTIEQITHNYTVDKQRFSLP